jgi:hypothetical protein
MPNSCRQMSLKTLTSIRVCQSLSRLYASAPTLREAWPVCHSTRHRRTRSQYPKNTCRELATDLRANSDVFDKVIGEYLIWTPTPTRLANLNSLQFSMLGTRSFSVVATRPRSSSFRGATYARLVRPLRYFFTSLTNPTEREVAPG